MGHKQVPRIILRGDQEKASLMAREGMRQLDILKNLMGFQNLKQDVRKVRFIDRSEIICRSIFGIDDVQIYVPEKRVAREEKICSIQLLTYTVIPKPFPLISEITSEGFCLEGEGEGDSDCEIVLTKEPRKFKNVEVGYVQNLSQCKYCYKENEGEDDEIVRKASLFHYDNIWPVGGFTRIVRVVNHNGTADFELGIQIFIPPGGVVDLIGALSEDLTKLYISLYSASGYVPLKERSLLYKIYSLVETNEGNRWELSGNGFTPIGYSYVDNVLTRTGHCGCWQKDVEETDKETLVYADTEYHTSAVPTDYGSPGSGGCGYEQGTIVSLHYFTFSLEDRCFLASNKLEAFHMSPYLKDYAVCEASESNAFSFGGDLYNYTKCVNACRTMSCDFCPAQPTYPIRTSKFDTTNIWEAWNGGQTFLYRLANGLDSYGPGWGKFTTGLYQNNISAYGGEMSECPCPVAPAVCKAFGSGESYHIQGQNDLIGQYTNRIYRHREGIERTITYHGDGNFNDLLIISFNDSVRYNYQAAVYCGLYLWHEDFFEDTGYVPVKRRDYLSPIPISLRYDAISGWETIGNSFISYDEETDSLIRGIRYKAIDGKWYWKIKAKIPECDEKFIESEIEALLSSEHFNRLEAIIFTESPVMRHKYTIRREIQRSA